MSELRQDRITGEWVIIAPDRGQRPRHFAGAATPAASGPFDPACPFCPGNEAQLPGIVAQSSPLGVPGWQVRVVPNKFPALRPDVPTRGLSSETRCIAGYGFHEVVIEHPRHDIDLVTMSGSEIEAVVSVYWQRFSTLLQQPGIQSVILFRNHGKAGGASLVHPHAQLIALGMVPPWIASVSQWARACHEEESRCVTCDELASELGDGRRIVDENGSFVALVPFAATVPSEVWLVPRRHQASFGDISETERRDMSILLQRTLRRVRMVYDDPPYNFVVDSGPTADLHAPYLHWRLRIAPDLATRGGFELGTRLPINPSTPEEDAALLRRAATE